jgi:hypothetical protein
MPMWPKLIRSLGAGRSSEPNTLLGTMVKENTPALLAEAACERNLRLEVLLSMTISL